MTPPWSNTHDEDIRGLFGPPSRRWYRLQPARQQAGSVLRDAPVRTPPCNFHAVAHGVVQSDPVAKVCGEVAKMARTKRSVSGGRSWTIYVRDNFAADRVERAAEL